MPNNHGTVNGDDNRIEELYEIVVTGNGEHALREQVRTLRRDMQEVIEMKATLDRLEKASDVQAGREDEKKSQIDARQRRETRQNNITTLVFVFLGLVISFMVWRNETNKTALEQKLDSATQQLNNATQKIDKEPHEREKHPPSGQER
jgi:hypothetical protein